MRVVEICVDTPTGWDPTFGGMGPKSIWHYVDTIYATSASLARASKAERHVVASRKADFLAALQAVLTPAPATT